ncbi:helix-turn-helix domain-containing protein [Adlercreutzia sp. R25]|uniref:Helix-turn-helix domain-containing protein n=1 Tax=Adlercreutzia shanghongiae TaxID=3111773 RepID=A0ABU6J108_9ACTN|nr:MULTISPECIES: helix-turn-helix domain-containing protein [unclassified Adlercreutzia]MEC4273755.1 helix-turn-helix domain-containing protein [Adlercreutzia sp. R25]MEC4295834.1 helix-turn-helix domain-containing protein [Adlercreutzia sp. R22]
MITVGDVMNMRAFDSIWLAAPCEGAAAREVTGVGTLDHEPFTGHYDLFSAGEFIFTTLGFAAMHPDLAEQALLELIERDVAAIAVKPVVLKAVGERVAAASAARGVPVLFYEGRYMERVIADLMNALDDDAAEWERTSLIDSILASSDEQAVRATFFTIAGVTGATIQCMAVRAVTDDDASLRALQRVLEGVLTSYGERWDDVERTFVCRYRGTLLGFVSFKRPPLKAIAISDADLEKCVATAGPLVCGISQEVSLGEGDLAVRQAMAALTTALKEGRETVRWTTLRFDAFRAAARSDRLYARSADLLRSLLFDYDAENDAELARTAEAFAANYGEVRATADVLFQHPNTVRYRLKKIKDVLAMESASDRELAALLTLVYLP